MVARRLHDRDGDAVVIVFGRVAADTRCRGDEMVRRAAGKD